MTDKTGLLCRICTGCGRCGGVVERRYDVVTTSKLSVPERNLKNPMGRRLVTADIGTTTIAMRFFAKDGSLLDEYAAVNPQVKYGADVISRIRAAEDEVKASDMRSMVHAELGKGFKKFKDGLSEEESLFCVLAANTTMVYLLMGYDTGELGSAPFNATHLDCIHTYIEDVETVVFPGYSAFVGGDIAAGMYACAVDKPDGITLFIDLGTNGEIAIFERGRVIASATAAGPAFEGGANKGIWGSDMVAILSRLKKEQIIDGTGLLRDEYFDDGVRIGNVLVTQKAIRELQLAKAAVAAGIQILIKEFGTDYGHIDRVVLAGGFGYYIDSECAADIGLLPKELAKKCVSGGNTALLGAYILGAELISCDCDENNALVKKSDVRIINLAEYEGFDSLYLDFLDLEGWCEKKFQVSSTPCAQNIGCFAENF